MSQRVTKFLPRDIAAWIVTTMIQTGRVPHRKVLQTRYDLSRATAYRWHTWARDYYRALSAGRAA